MIVTVPHSMAAPRRWVGDKVSDNRDGHRWTSTDIGGLFSQVNVCKGAGQQAVMVAWGSRSHRFMSSSPSAAVARVSAHCGCKVADRG
jgi:hypothetical protein